MPFMGPTQDEVAAISTDLIARFGLQAHDEALHLIEVATQMRFPRNRKLYRQVAREIEVARETKSSFIEARDRLNVITASEAGQQS